VSNTVSSTPRALVIRTAGTNCDAEMVRAFQIAGADVDLLHIDALIKDPARIDHQLIGFPGGFSYGDDIASGRVLAVKLRERLYPALRDAAKQGALMIGVCNGFQVMTQVGLLPGPENENWPGDDAPTPTIALEHNASARFIDRWVRVEPNNDSPCVWTRDLWDDDNDRADVMQLPVAHGEGRFVASDEVIRELEDNGQIALRYAEDVNGSAAAIAGVCDPTGRIFALMPHPERYTTWRHHPYATRLHARVRTHEPPGLRFFQNAVAAAREGNPAASPS